MIMHHSVDKDIKAKQTVIQWAPKVKQAKLRRLYESDVCGIQDDELLNDVALDLYLRCVSILEVSETVRGRAKCRVCGAVIDHDCQSPIRCAACGWEESWRTYQRSYQKKQLHGGAALPFFQAYVATFDLTRPYAHKMLAVDTLIHQYHWNYSRQLNQMEATRPAAANLIEGRGMREVIAFLEGLSNPSSESQMVMAMSEVRGASEGNTACQEEGGSHHDGVTTRRHEKDH